MLITWKMKMMSTFMKMMMMRGEGLNQAEMGNEIALVRQRRTNQPTASCMIYMHFINIE